MHFTHSIALAILRAAALVTAVPMIEDITIKITRAPLAPFFDHHRYGTIKNSYIVMLKQGAPTEALQNHFNFLQAAHEADSLVNDSFADDSFAIGHVYNVDSGIRGYSGRFSQGAVNKLHALPEVDFVEQDQIVRTQDVQTSPPWVLARISHRDKLIDGVYVIDTGINIQHVEFEGRTSWGKTIPKNDVDEDVHGHGTHCAGTIASRKYSVAKGASVIAVKVLTLQGVSGTHGNGSLSDVLAGITFAAAAAAKDKQAQAKEKATRKTMHKGSVASLDQAVNAAVDAGLHFAVAAGNDNRDTCSYSPAAAEKAVTVGASTVGDERAYFSNHGPCVNVFAPGLNILSTWISRPDATATISGTSMASPHTAGMLAYLLSLYPSKSFDPELGMMAER
ncbi:peptidase S8/S53 domain-containing protein [Mycena epipterygia]|nr:peptidase S8/S53 domain-containing protein [Mycena epipterygia]